MPTASNLASLSGVLCPSCFKRSAKSRCAQCKRVVYCNRECQQRNWPTHKHYCKKTPAQLAQVWNELESQYVASVGSNAEQILDFVRQVGPAFSASEDRQQVLHCMAVLGMVLQQGRSLGRSDQDIDTFDKKFVEICNDCVEYGADVDAQDRFGNTALHLCCVSNTTPMIAFLLEHTPVRLDLRNDEGKTAEECCKPEGKGLFEQARHLPDEYRTYLIARSGEKMVQIVDGITKVEGRRGMSFLATRDIDAGQLLLRESALACGGSHADVAAKLVGVACDKLSELHPRRGGTLNVDRIIEVCSRNAFSTSSYETCVNNNVDIGSAPSALFHLASFFNHSCWPNCHWTIVGTTIFVRAVESIRKG